jgi:hypothetical protein
MVVEQVARFPLWEQDPDRLTDPLDRAREGSITVAARKMVQEADICLGQGVTFGAEAP